MKSGSTKSIKNSQKDTSETKVDLIWLWHSCLYGHKENLKKILLNFSNLIKINETRVNGNTALHLGIFGNHLPVTQILLGRVCEKMSSDYSKITFADTPHITWWYVGRLLKDRYFLSKIWPIDILHGSLRNLENHSIKNLFTHSWVWKWLKVF